MRQVYFDPYGMYTEGFDKGMVRQMDLERSARTARDSDYGYNVVEPLRLRQAQRDDWLGERALPYRLDNIRYGTQVAQNNAFNSNLGIADSAAMRMGAVAPVYGLYNDYYKWNQGVDPATGNMVTRDANGNEVARQADPYNSMLNYILEPRAMAQAQWQEQMRLRGEQEARAIDAAQQAQNWQQLQIWQQMNKGAGGGAPFYLWGNGASNAPAGGNWWD